MSWYGIFRNLNDTVVVISIVSLQADFSTLFIDWRPV